MTGAEIPLFFALTTAASAAVGVVGAMQQGKAASQAAEYNAAVAERNAGVAHAQASAEIQAKAIEQARHFGNVRAQFGSSGIEFSGSALDVFQDQLTSAEHDKQLIKYKGDMKALGFNDEATLARMNAKNSVTAGYIGAASAVTKSIGSIATYGSGQRAAA